MEDEFSPIIEVSELVRLRGADQLIIIDATGGPNAQSDYEAKHLDGALFADLDTQLAEIQDDVAIGGRHPLPTTTKFAKMLAALGIKPGSHVVIYDHNNGANAAARFWWMLKATGHQKVQVLNGGFQEAEKQKFPINSEKVKDRKTEVYHTDPWKLPLADMEEVENVSGDKHHLVIDVRSAERYRGESEPIDLVAGHIPGAVNVPFTENLDANGLFLSPDRLRRKYKQLLGPVDAGSVIVHCGSGVTACHTLLAMDYAGLEIPKLYVGSWSEWSRNDKAVATESKNQ